MCPSGLDPLVGFFITFIGKSNLYIMKNIDFKSILIGILATTTFFLATGYSSSNEGQVGTYQFEYLIDNKYNNKQLYVMDTRTGRLEYFYYSPSNSGSSLHNSQKFMSVSSSQIKKAFSK